MVFKILGAIIALWGVADFIVGLQGGDLWAQVGIQLPDLVWKYSHYIAIVAGIAIFSIGGGGKEEPRS